MAFSSAFQGNAFQNSEFQTEVVTGTLHLQLPINCVLAGNQPYESSGRTFEGGPAKIKYIPRMTAGGLRKID